VAQVEQERERTQQQLAEALAMVNTAPGKLDDLWQSLRKIKDEAAAAGKRVATLASANERLEKENKDLQRQEKTGLAREVEKLLAARKGMSRDQAMAELQEKLEQLAELEQRIQDLKRGNASLVDQIQGAGKGVEMPSCWYDAKGSIEYLFEVRLTSDGFIVSATDLPHRVKERADLPTVEVPLGRTIGAETFLRTTDPIYAWSKKKVCRFFVRVYDDTLPTEKALFKQRLRTVEGHFYKKLV
jgi:hypothetical protein